MSGTGDHVLPISMYGASPRVGTLFCFGYYITNSLSRQLREERENQLDPGLAIRAIARYLARDNF